MCSFKGVKPRQTRYSGRTHISCRYNGGGGGEARQSQHPFSPRHRTSKRDIMNEPKRTRDCTSEKGIPEQGRPYTPETGTPLHQKRHTFYTGTHRYTFYTTTSCTSTNLLAVRPSIITIIEPVRRLGMCDIYHKKPRYRTACGVSNRIHTSISPKDQTKSQLTTEEKTHK